MGQTEKRVGQEADVRDYGERSHAGHVQPVKSLFHMHAI
jgi:hypothetical protein